eukprot:SAG11_NODE_7582_length_1125_cov_2.097466_1_plen_302_part_10
MAAVVTHCCDRGYEISGWQHNHRSDFFRDLDAPGLRSATASLGYDFDTIVAAKDRLRRRLETITPAEIAANVGGGFLGSFDLLGADPALASWLRFRKDSLTQYFGAVSAGVKNRIERTVLMGVGPRSACFAPLCGYDFQALTTSGGVDIILPKHYFFHRGFDGLVGTVGRWVESLTEWNTGLTDADALKIVAAIFGIELPAVESRLDLETVLEQPAFYASVVHAESARALAAVGGDPARVVPWLDTGRLPHSGDAMTAGALRRLMEAAHAAGLRCMNYHHHGNLSEGEWTVMSALCGKMWVR